MTTDRVVIVGSSVGGVRAAQALRDNGFEGDVVLVGAESAEPYDKPPLSKGFLAGEQAESEILLMPSGGWESHNITRCLGRRACGLNVAQRHVQLEGGETLDYDALIIATGVRARTMGKTDNRLIHTVRELQEAVDLRATLSSAKQLVIVGGGFIGSEIASTAVKLGVDVTIIEALPTPFSRVLGVPVGAMIEELHVKHGVSVVSGATVVDVEYDGPNSGTVHLQGGLELPASAVVVGIGCLPNTEWLSSSGLDIEDGVLADEYGRVPDQSGIYVVGDVARWFDPRSQSHRRREHWTNTVQQAQMVAHNITNPDDRIAQTKAPYFWSDQHGFKIQMAGSNAPTDKVEILQCETAVGKREVALYSDHGRFTAVVAFGWPQVLPKLRRAWENGASLSDARLVIHALTV